jgi:hypothetical protein
LASRGWVYGLSPQAEWTSTSRRLIVLYKCGLEQRSLSGGLFVCKIDRNVGVGNGPMKPPQKITLGEMCAMGILGLLIYCSDYKCNHSAALSAISNVVTEADDLFCTARASDV